MKVEVHDGIFKSPKGPTKDKSICIKYHCRGGYIAAHVKAGLQQPPVHLTKIK